MLSSLLSSLRRRLPDLPLAAASIGGFWLFYFLTILLRMALLDESFRAIEYRALGCLVGVVLTFIVYIVLTRAADEPIRIKIIAAAIACLPAAAIFSTFNLAFALHQPLQGRAVITQRAENSPGRSEAAARIQITRPPLSDETLRSLQRQRVPRLIADGLVTWYFFFAAWASFYLAMSSAAQLRRAERRAARAERVAQAAQLKALRYQVNPHFLFNTLNSLSALVMARREEEAEEMIVNLSTFFRSSLTIEPAEDIRLGQELEFQRLYLDIEQVRFPRRLAVEVAVPDALRGARVPPLILQPVIENAIKHGVACTSAPVTLSISAREEDGRLILMVENDLGAGVRTPPSAGTGTGLVNVCERLAARFGERAQCRHGPLPAGGYRVTLAMPLEHDDPINPIPDRR
ncbi:MAG TPA: histidine kinase [Allosphingosinicella sp.]|nr:histidine kinase [Allosphingosinicella sp.]